MRKRTEKEGTDMTDEERVLSCQREIRRLRSVVRDYEEERRVFLEWLET